MGTINWVIGDYTIGIHSPIPYSEPGRNGLGFFEGFGVEGLDAVQAWTCSSGSVAHRRDVL